MMFAKEPKEMQDFRLIDDIQLRHEVEALRAAEMRRLLRLAHGWFRGLFTGTDNGTGTRRPA